MTSSNGTIVFSAVDPEPSPPNIGRTTRFREADGLSARPAILSTYCGTFAGIESLRSRP